MFSIANNQVTFSYTNQALLQRLGEFSAQMSLTLPSPDASLTSTDAFAITADESSTIDLLLQSSAVTAADEFDKIGQYVLSADGTHSFSALCDDRFLPHAQQADIHLQEWLVWHTLTRWLRLRHLDKPANWTLMQATVAFSALHKDLFTLRS